MIKKNSDSEIFDIFAKNYQRYLDKRAGGATPVRALVHLIAAVEDPSFFRTLFRNGDILESGTSFAKATDLAGSPPAVKKETVTTSDIKRALIAAKKADPNISESLVQAHGYGKVSDLETSFQHFFRELNDIKDVKARDAFTQKYEKELKFLYDYKQKKHADKIEAAEASANKNLETEGIGTKSKSEPTEPPNKPSESGDSQIKSKPEGSDPKSSGKGGKDEIPTSAAGRAWETIKRFFGGIVAIMAVNGLAGTALMGWGAFSLYKYFTEDKIDAAKDAAECLSNLSLKEGSEADKQRKQIIKDINFIVDSLNAYKASEQEETLLDYLGNNKQNFTDAYLRVTGKERGSVVYLQFYISQNPEEVDDSFWAQVLDMQSREGQAAAVSGAVAARGLTGAILTEAAGATAIMGGIAATAVAVVTIGGVTYFVSDLWTQKFSELQREYIECALSGVQALITAAQEAGAAAKRRDEGGVQPSGPVKSKPFDRTDLTQSIAGYYIDLEVDLGDGKKYKFRMIPEYDFKTNNFPLGFGNSLVKAVKLLGTLPGRSLIGDPSSTDPSLSLGIIPSGNTMEDRIAGGIVFIIKNNIDSAKKLNSYIKELHNLGIGDSMFGSYKSTVKKQTGAPRAFMSDLLNLSTSNATVQLIGKRLKQGKNSTNSLHKTSNTIINHSIGGDLNLNKVAQQKISYFSNATKGLKDQLAQSYYAGYDDLYNQKPEKKPDNYNQLYGFQKETGKDLIQSAHPRSIYLADAIGNGGLVENSLEQSDRTHSVALSVPSGNFINRYAQVVDRLTKLAKTAKEQNKPEALILINQTIKNIQKLGE
jgi:hypothetical protein